MYKYLFLAVLFLQNTNVFASQHINGTVKDNEGNPLIGATVTLKQQENTVMVTMTGFDGIFDFQVKEGNYSLLIEYIGYKEVFLEHVIENPVTVQLSERKTNEIDEVTIRGAIEKQSINAIYAMQKEAVSISDGIAADIISRSPDKNTGEVLKRLSGTTIQDNKFVIIRGLNDRYNTSLVDNAVLPSTEANRKAFSFDIIPSAMIDHITITKAGTPELPGDFAGGAIHILTKEIPTGNFNEISIGTGFNTTSTGKTFLSGKRDVSDFLGFANSVRQLPSGFLNSREINNINPNKPEQSSVPLNQLQNDFSIRETKTLPAISFQGSLGRLFYTKSDHKIGITAALTYNHSQEVRESLKREYDNYNYRDNAYKFSTNLGALLNAGYVFGGHKINLKTFYNRILDDQFLFREGYNFGTSSEVNYYAFDLMQKSLFKTTLSGDHEMGEGKLDWLISYNFMSNNQPDQRKVSYSRSQHSTEPFIADITTLGKANNRLFSDLNESIWNGGLNYAIPFNFLHESNLKIGTFGQYRHRDFQNRYLGALLNSMHENAEDVRKLPMSDLFSEKTINQGAFILTDQTLDGDTYFGKTSTIGGFAMIDNRISSNLRAVWGARLESYHVLISTPDKTEAENRQIDILPSLNFTYSLNDYSNLRASYFRSVARPELREMTALTYYDYEISATISGSPQLKRTQIDNLDLRYEWFPNPGEIISASLFYKNFRNAIENEVYAAGSAYEITPFNSEKATNLGVEIEIRKSLKFLGELSFLRNMHFYLNLAYIHSEVKTNNLYVLGEKMESRALSGQAPYVVNTSLGYSSENGKLNLNLLYNRIGQRLHFIGQDRMGFIYETSRNLLDFQIGYAVSKKSEFKLNFKDLLNEPVLFYFDQNSNKKFDGSAFSEGRIIDGQDWIWRSYKPGSSVSLSYSYKF